jgi:hydroxymethylglutaryl-CoA reductase (NADPH)
VLFRVPKLLLKQLYTFGSLASDGDAVRFSLKNRLSDARLVGLRSLAIDGAPVDLARVTLGLADGRRVAASAVAPGEPLEFPLRGSVAIEVSGFGALEKGNHELEIACVCEPFGELSFKVQDAIAAEAPQRPRIPYDKSDDHSREWAERRRRFAEQYAGVRLEHIAGYSFDPATTRGNVESFIGVAQVPIGLAGPLHVRGEHAQGEFLIPLATTEGTLVASYNRGMKVLNLCGGVTATVVADAMQRAPVFVFGNARDAREFSHWVRAHMAEIAEQAEETSTVAKLQDIDIYQANKFAYLRFNFSTGDAAGQNMVGRATFAACSWILDVYPNVRRFYLESNFATDKKASQINIMRTRGKRVTAEALIRRDVLIQQLRVDTESLAYHYNVANVGSILSGANNNGLHSANAITAMFIATGQDVANVAESSAGILYAELTPEKDLYLSITIPSLIVATHGGGTGLPTQQECLGVLGCQGVGKVRKLAEIVAAAVLAGVLSLAAAISSAEWVSSHEQYGRNR